MDVLTDPGSLSGRLGRVSTGCGVLWRVTPCIERDTGS